MDWEMAELKYKMLREKGRI
jgi:hypothetical protein